MEAVGLGEEADDLEQTPRTLFAGDKATINPNHQRHDTEAGGAQGDKIPVSGKDFDGHASVGMSGLPVVAKGGLLHHGEQFVVREHAGRSLDFG